MQDKTQRTAINQLHELESIAQRYAHEFEHAGRETYGEDAEKAARKAKTKLTAALTEFLGKIAAPQAAPAAVAVPDELIRAAKQALACMDGLQQHLGRAVCQVEADALRAALAATPAMAINPEECAQEVFKNGASVGLFDIPKETANAICAGISLATGARVDWHYIAGRVHIKALAATPAAAPDMVSVNKEDANNYCRILAALGMEEEGDPVAEVQRLLSTAAAPVVLPELGEIDQTAPERIYLVVNPVGNPEDRSGSFSNCSEVSWCATSQGGVEVAYVRADRALLATATGLPAQAVEMPDFDLRTSKGGRGFVAWYFANVLQRYDYENYITNKLAADFACDLAKALSSTLAAPQAQADARAAELLGFLQDQCIDLRCFTTSDGEDVGWRTVQHHMSEPRERVVSEVYGDQPRRAIREAMARIERDPYCTGPLHLEDDAAIAAAKGE